MVNRSGTRKDIHIVEIPGTEIAEEIGDKRLANIVLLGGLIQAAKIFPISSVESALEKNLEGKKGDLLKKNIDALRKGATYTV
jgi:2-oxoglutarate ferredoxin oxidoreductase subunit gamma